MNFKLPRPIAATALVALAATAAVSSFGQPPPRQPASQTTNRPASPPAQDRANGPEDQRAEAAASRPAVKSAPESAVEPSNPPPLTLKPVPEWVRLHLPLLGRELGVLVDTVRPASPPHRLGLRSGDILVEAGGQPVTARSGLGAIETALPLVVIRRGQPQVLPEHPPAQALAPVWDGDDEPDHWRQPAWPPPPPPLPFAQPRRPAAGQARSSASASSVAVASQADGASISIARSGSRLSVEISVAGSNQPPTRLQGTRSEIEQQLGKRVLPQTIKSQVRRLLRTPGH